MTIALFTDRYKHAWETSDEHALVRLFAPDGVYHNTPFAQQHGPAAIAAYWQRTKLQSDIRLDYEILAEQARGGIAHWHVTYQVTSEELFRIWAASTGTSVIVRLSAFILLCIGVQIAWNGLHGLLSSIGSATAS